MKVEIKDSTVPNTNWPKLMSSEDGLCVLFTCSGSGTVIKDTRKYCGAYVTGFYTDDWHMSQFTDFHGTITLSNGENQ